MNFLLCVTCFVTVYTLVIIAIYRYAVIVKNGEYSNRKIVIVLIAIWLIATASCIPILLIYEVEKFEYPPYDPYYYCNLIDKPKNGPILTIGFFIFGFALPLSIIATLYLIIFKYVRDTENNLNRNNNIKDIERNLKKKNTDKDKERVKKSQRIGRILGIVVLVFVVCWLPLHVFLLYVNFSKNISLNIYFNLTLLITHACAYSNSAVNPIVYNFVSRDFRDAFKNIFYDPLQSKCSSGDSACQELNAQDQPRQTENSVM